MAGYYLAGRGARRVHGGGFAGTIQAYVAHADVEDFCATMDAVFGAGACRVLHLRPLGAFCLEA
jgi:galactokinase